MLIPVNVDVPMDRYPIANWILIGVTVLISLAIFAEPETSNPYVWLIWPGENFAPIQLIGSVFAHADLSHLVGNMVFLFVFGNAINAKLGHLMFLALYAGAAVFEGLVWIAVADGPALGASGAIMGTVGAFLVLYPRNDVTMFWWIFIRGGTFSVPAVVVIGLYLAFDIWGFVGQHSDGVAYAAHLAGFSLGFVAAIGLLLLRIIKPSKWEQTLLQMFGR